MAIHVERLVRKVVERHDFSADKAFQRQSREHIQSEAETGNVDHDIVGGEIVQHISLSHVAEVEVAGQSHKQTCDHRYGC